MYLDNQIADFNQYIIINLYQYLDTVNNVHTTPPLIRLHNAKVISECIKHMDTLNPRIEVIEGYLITLVSA